MRKRLLFAGMLMLFVSGASACGSSTTSPGVTQITNFVSRLQQGGSAWRSIPVLTAGDVTVDFTAITQADAIMGLGLGTVNGTDCVLTKSVQTAADTAATAPQITATLPIGTYCVKLYDIGNLTSIIDFTVVVTTPY
jgi:hypothetical protein